MSLWHSASDRSALTRSSSYMAPFALLSSARIKAWDMSKPLINRVFFSTLRS